MVKYFKLTKPTSRFFWSFFLLTFSVKMSNKTQVFKAKKVKKQKVKSVIRKFVKARFPFV